MEHEYKTSPAYQIDEPDDFLSYRLNLMEGVYEKPDQPEPLTILRKLRRFNLAMWPGAYADQPNVLMAELNVVIECEIAQQNLMNQNALLRLRAKQLIGEKD